MLGRTLNRGESVRERKENDDARYICAAGSSFFCAFLRQNHFSFFLRRDILSIRLRFKSIYQAFVPSWLARVFDRPSKRSSCAKRISHKATKARSRSDETALDSFIKLSWLAAHERAPLFLRLFAAKSLQCFGAGQRGRMAWK